MSRPHFTVLATESIRVYGAKALGRKRRMSPYAWRNPAGDVSMLFRAVDETGPTTGALWLARGNGLTFKLKPGPVLKPGPEEFDVGGCEDPTVVHIDRNCLVYYTGLNGDGVAQLLWAEGPDIRSLRKRGVAHASTSSERNTKEATVERRGDNWLLLFEYGAGGKSHIGRGEAKAPEGPWKETSDPLTLRRDHWDSWHLSTGPILIDQAGGPIMFYNAADAGAIWQGGWVQFDEDLSRVKHRCDQPLLPAPTHADAAGRRITFTASVIDNQDILWLYYTHNDQSLRRALVRRSSKT